MSSIVEISNQAELTNFLQDNETTKGLIVNSIELNAQFGSLSSSTHKIIYSNAPSRLIKSTNNDFTDVGREVYKDMSNIIYNYRVSYDSYPEYFPDMASLIDENIVQGDKAESDTLLASAWNDWGDDVFDGWGFFYIYDVNSGKYYFPLISPQNESDGALFTQEVTAFGRTFTIIHGYPAQGIFKFDITVNDNLPFRFGAYGNMGSDGDHVITNLTYPYSIGSTNLNLYYVKQEEDGTDFEIIYSYFIPKNISENQTQTYNIYQNDYDSNNSLMSTTVTNGLIVYFAKTNDVKQSITPHLGGVLH